MSKIPKVFIIAEAGVNHNGRLDFAKKLIDAAAESKADAVKFQTFVASAEVCANAPKAAYQRKSTGDSGSQLEMLQRLELSAEMHQELIRHCKKRGIKFLSTPFDLISIRLLDSLGLKIIKIPSGEITNWPYLKTIGSLKKKLILSTGMSTLTEVSDALKVLTRAGTPKKDITILHCHTDYPTAYSDVNLRAMLTIRKKLKVAIGYSDHTPGIEVAVAAVALGATVIEKHFTLDRDLPGPDHKASLEPQELEVLVQAVRNVEQCLGDGIKRPSPSEKKNIAIVRKSIVAAETILKGDTFSEENLTTKRPGTGLTPICWDRVIGKKANKNFEKDEFISL